MTAEHFHCCGQAVFALCPIFFSCRSLWSEVRGSVAASYSSYIFVLPWLPTVCSHLLRLKSILLAPAAQFAQITHSRLVTFWLGAGVCLQIGVIMGKANEKPKCRWFLISFDDSYLLLVFLHHLSHDPISFSFRVFPVSRWPLNFLSLISFHFYFLSTLHYLFPIWFPFPSVPLSHFLLQHFPLMCGRHSNGSM